MGNEVTYLFSHAYEWMLPPSIKEKTIFIGYSTSISSMLKDTLNLKNIRLIKEVFSEHKPNYVYLHNYHLLNHSIAKSCRKNGGKFIFHAHEPYVENKHAHGGFQQYWLYLNEYMEAKLLHNSDVAVVSSKEGSRLFNKAYPWFKGRKGEIPLLYEDLGNGANLLSDRKYITFVGPPVPAKGPEIFLKIVDFAAAHYPNMSFLLISRERITDPKFLNKNNLSIYHKTRISDEEYGNLMKNSLAVLTPYKRETQSSVVLVSYMYGTPVVSSNIGGLPEFVNNGITGYIVDLDATVEEWIDAINQTQNNAHTMRLHCRRYFEENFSGKNWKKYLEQLL
jgi:glycosyltransferase involved in cell wall biosynthesis